MGTLARKLYRLECEDIIDKEGASVVSEDLSEVNLLHQ